MILISIVRIGLTLQERWRMFGLIFWRIWSWSRKGLLRGWKKILKGLLWLGSTLALKSTNIWWSTHEWQSFSMLLLATTLMKPVGLVKTRSGFLISMDSTRCTFAVWASLQTMTRCVTCLWKCSKRWRRRRSRLMKKATCFISWNEIKEAVTTTKCWACANSKHLSIGCLERCVRSWETSMFKIDKELLQLLKSLKDSWERRKIYSQRMIYPVHSSTIMSCLKQRLSLSIRIEKWTSHYCIQSMLLFRRSY